MTSGLYKYIVFDEIERSTGRVYDEPCHRIMDTGDELPNTDWVAANHWCVPLYYAPEAEAATEPARRAGGRVSRVLITGGSGFIGSHVVDSLLDAGHEVVNYDLRPSPYHSPDEIETVIGDLDDTDAIAAALRGCDAAIHLAACADVGIVIEDPAGAERANSRGTLSVLEACRAEGVKRVVYGSTIWVYDGSDDDPVTEDSALNLPKHLYTATKLAGEMYCTSYAELYGLEPTILRFGIPYGPRARPATVIAIFIDKALAGRAADAGRRRHADAALRLRQGPRRRRRPRARPRRPPTASTTSPAPRR